MDNFFDKLCNTLINSILALSDPKIYREIRKRKKNNGVITRYLTDVKNRSYSASSVTISTNTQKNVHKY